MYYSHSESINDFVTTLSGHFSNKVQALENPKDFAHINIYIRPLPFSIFNGVSLYSEQSYDYSPWKLLFLPFSYTDPIHRSLTVSKKTHKLKPDLSRR